MHTKSSLLCNFAQHWNFSIIPCCAGRVVFYSAFFIFVLCFRAASEVTQWLWIEQECDGKPICGYKDTSSAIDSEYQLLVFPSLLNITWAPWITHNGCKFEFNLFISIYFHQDAHPWRMIVGKCSRTQVTVRWHTSTLGCWSLSNIKVIHMPEWINGGIWRVWEDPEANPEVVRDVAGTSWKHLLYWKFTCFTGSLYSKFYIFPGSLLEWKRDNAAPQHFVMAFCEGYFDQLASICKAKAKSFQLKRDGKMFSSKRKIPIKFSIRG